MKGYYRVMLGRQSKFATDCFEQGFIGADFDIRQDLTGMLQDDWKSFNQKLAPIFLHRHPEKTKIAAGLACSALWMVCKGIEIGDIVLSHDGEGRYRVGMVSGEYYYVSDADLPHRRPVHWTGAYIDRSFMSEALRNSVGSIGTISTVTRHGDEIERFLSPLSGPKLFSVDAAQEDVSAFALESHLEEFLVKNWTHTLLGKDYDIYEEDGRKGQQFPTDTGPMDILAVSKDKQRLLVVELKKGRASDATVGQTLRYMSFVQDSLAGRGETVHGAIIALEDDPRIRRSLKMVSNVAFYRYEVDFRLVQA